MTPYQKSVICSLLLGLALVQLITIGLALGRFGNLSPAGRGKTALAHRAGGLVGLAAILFVAYYCLQLLPGSSWTGRVWMHALIGAIVLVLVVSKAAIRGAIPRLYLQLPLLGGLLFLFIIALWISSAGWYFLIRPSGY